MTLANKLTLFRLALVPVFMVMLTFPNLWARILALFIFIGASLTDLYDGKLARRTGTVTRIGTFLDPLADKILIAAALISFVALHELRIPAWLVILIIGREFLITGLRSLAAARGIVMASESAGKWKTGIQIAAIIIILLILITNIVFERWSSLFWQWPHPLLHALTIFLTEAPWMLVSLAMLITVISGALYIRKYRRMLREELAMQKSPAGK